MSVATKVLDEVAGMQAIYRAWQRRELEYVIDLPEDEKVLTQMSFLMTSPEHLAESQLLWVTKEMGRLLLHASAQLPPYDFSPEVLPWKKAACFLEEPLQVVQLDGLRPILGYQWSDLLADNRIGGDPDRKGLHIVNLLSRSFGSQLAPVGIATLVPGSKWGGLRGGLLNTDDGIEIHTAQTGRLLCTLWLLLQQRVAVKRTLAPDRAGRRRWERAGGGPIPEVIVVELRRPLSQEHEDDGEHGFVDWSHRWIVDGHWRNQWHPSTGTHTPTWIAPYVKGPEDKPLVVKRKIGAWVR